MTRGRHYCSGGKERERDDGGVCMRVCTEGTQCAQPERERGGLLFSVDSKDSLPSSPRRRRAAKQDTDPVSPSFNFPLRLSVPLPSRQYTQPSLSSRAHFHDRRPRLRRGDKTALGRAGNATQKGGNGIRGGGKLAELLMGWEANQKWELLIPPQPRSRGWRRECVHCLHLCRSRSSLASQHRQRRDGRRRAEKLARKPLLPLSSCPRLHLSLSSALAPPQKQRTELSSPQLSTRIIPRPATSPSTIAIECKAIRFQSISRGGEGTPRDGLSATNTPERRARNDNVAKALREG